jgi:SAM-dependent methyltransferase
MMATFSQFNPSYILESPSAERNKGPIYDLVLSPIIFSQLIQQQKQQQHANSNYERPKIRVLELAAGCGVHTIHFVSSFLSTFSSSSEEDGAESAIDIEWHPSDPDLDARKSINARVQLSNLHQHILPCNSWILGTSGGTACNDGGHRDIDGKAGARQSGTIGNAQEYASHHKYFDLILCINMIHIAPWEATLGLMECAGKVLKKGGVLMCYGPYKVDGMAVESNLRFDASLRSKDPQWGVRDLEDVIDVAKREGLEYVLKEDMPSNNLSVIFRKM